MLWQVAHKTSCTASSSPPLSGLLSYIFTADGGLDLTSSYDPILTVPVIPRLRPERMILHRESQRADSLRRRRQSLAGG